MNRATGHIRPIVLWGIICCLSLLLAGSSAAQTFFTDVTDETFAFSRLPFGCQSTSWGDYDNDGWPDLFLTARYNPRVILWHNEGAGRFVDRTATIQGDLTSYWKGWGSVFGDYDNDGDLDLYVPVGQYTLENRHRDILLRNDRGVFRDVGLEAGLTDNLCSGQALWLDYDRDGHLDLYVGRFMWYPPDPTSRDHLYRNQGDGTFADVTEEAGLKVQFQPDHGGSTCGMVAGDFNDDGWPDLYFAIWRAANRLFLNDGQGGFRDATTTALADTGGAWGMVAGDIDNDGDLDIFQAGGVTWEEQKVRSLLFINEGEGHFTNVVASAGLSGLLSADAMGAGMADIDNDGDLDLMACKGYTPDDRFFLYLGNGDGTFVDRTSQAGIPWNAWMSLAFGDYDLNGFLDVVFGIQGVSMAPFRKPESTEGFGGLYRNNGKDSHWLRVELVGRESNRNGIGARLIAASGDRQQIREIFGGVGINEDELVAHFGLGEHTRVDRLEIRWPSEHLDVLRDIPADRKIRVIEGSEEYHIVTPTVWEHTLPDSALLGTTIAMEAAVYPALFEMGAEIVSVIADLSDLGGSSAVPLVDVGDGSYRLESPAFTVDCPVGWRDVSVMIDQETSLGIHWIKLVASIAVVSNTDLAIYADGPGAGWTIQASEEAESDPYAADVVHSGSSAHAITLQRPDVDSSGSVTYIIGGGVELSRYTYLSFWIQPGEADIESLYVDIGGQASVQPFPEIVDTSAYLDLTGYLGDLGIVLRGDRWMEIRIPVADLRVKPKVYLPLDRGITERMPYLKFGGQATGTFYIDDMKLVSAKLPEPTAVETSREMALPERYALSQNYPNPFNPQTIIRYQLPEAGAVHLLLYNISGQLIRRLVDGAHPVGSYSVVWDGRDDVGRDVASGVYLCRMEARGYSAVRKLVLMR